MCKHFHTGTSPQPVSNHEEILSEPSLGWGKAALGFGPDRIETLVSMAKDSLHRVIMRKML